MPKCKSRSKRSIWKGKEPEDFKCPICKKPVSILVPQTESNEGDEQKFCCEKCKENLKAILR